MTASSSQPPTGPVPPTGAVKDGPRRSRGEITKLIREEAARRRHSEEVAAVEVRKPRIPYRSIIISVVITATLVAIGETALEVKTLLAISHPGDLPLKSVMLDDVTRFVPASGIRVESKRLLVTVSPEWTSLSREERRTRFSGLCAILANRAYHGATLYAADGHELGSWSQGLVQVE